MPSNHLILCHPLLFLPSIFPSIRMFSDKSVLRIRWPKYWGFSFNISPSNEHPGLMFRMDWLDHLTVQGTLKSLLQHHSSSGPHKCLALNSEPQITPALNLLSPPSPLPQQSLSLVPRQTLLTFKAQLKWMLLWQSDSFLSFNAC